MVVRRIVLWLHQGLGLSLLSLMSLPAIALAHGTNIQSRTTAAVEIQASYDSGEPMAEAQVQVYAPDEPQTPAFSGVTDTDGRYVFVPNQPGDWEVSVRQAGHGDITVISVAGETEAGATVAEGERAIAPEALPAAVEFSQSSGLSPLQRGIVAAAVTWGCVGTALYFRRGRQ